MQHPQLFRPLTQRGKFPQSGMHYFRTCNFDSQTITSISILCIWKSSTLYTVEGTLFCSPQTDRPYPCYLTSEAQFPCLWNGDITLTRWFLRRRNIAWTQFRIQVHEEWRCWGHWKLLTVAARHIQALKILLLPKRSTELMISQTSK